MAKEKQVHQARGQWTTALTMLALLVLVFHLLMLWYRWLRPNPDFLEFTASVVEILAIVSFLGLQTEIGQRFVLRLDETIVFQRLLNTPRRVLVASSAATLLAILALYVGSPLAAEAYRSRGVAASERGEYSQAIRAFQQALSLDPQQARSHYNLASAYEALYEFDAAITEYQLALQSEETFWPTYNNLGRLLITQRADPHAALAVLLDGYRRADSQLGQAVIGKNLAWAYLELDYYSTALRTIDQVLVQLQDLRSQGASADVYLAEAYMLRARILAASSNQQAALLAWQDSLGYALAVSESQACTAAVERLPQTCIDALRWVAAAREQIQVLSGGE